MLTAILVSAVSATAGEPITPLRRCDATVGALPAALDAAKRNVVLVRTVLGTGSGVFATPDGFVLTAAHVVGGARTVEVVLADGSTLTGEVVRRSVELDVALVRTSAGQSPCAAVANTRLAVGSDLYVVGSPGGDALSNSVSRGVVSAYRESEGQVILQTDASVNPGNSGGPMFSVDGSVAALVSFKRVGAGVEGLGFGVAVETVPAALGFAWSDTTANDFPVRLGDDSPPVPGPEIASRPASAALVKVAPKWCQRWVKHEKDPFSGAEVITTEQPYGVGNGWKIEVGQAGVTLRWAASVTALGVDTATSMGGEPVTMALAFADGTRVTLRSTGAPVLALSIPSPYNAIRAGQYLQYQFQVNADVIRAIGSSQLQAARFDFAGGGQATLPYEASTFTEDLANAGSCVAASLSPSK